MDINNVTLTGRLARQPELVYAASGTAICNAVLAVGGGFKGKDGKWVDKVSFIDISVFGSSAESLAQHQGKGDQIGVEGRLNQDSWEKEGQKHYRLKVIVNKVTFLGKKKQATEPAEPAQEPTQGQEAITY